MERTDLEQSPPASMRNAANAMAEADGVYRAWTKRAFVVRRVEPDNTTTCAWNWSGLTDEGSGRKKLAP
ncbi:MAG: hypothetical protein JNL08_21385 [Planctomycetes bacterium]|nr:hypothetical protein [Planctomycetota bacterium]